MKNQGKLIGKITRRSWRFVQGHTLAFGISAVAIVVAATFNVWFFQVKDTEITGSQQAAGQELARLEGYIKQTKDKKAAEEAAAKQVANAAAKGMSGTLDSKMCNTATSHNDPSLIDVLVNKKHCIQPITFEPSDLVATNGATVSAKAADAFNQLYAAAAAAGQPFYVTSSYRSYGSQASTYNKWVSTSGQVGADTYSARPGYSEHQTGLAFDVAASECTLDCFGSTPQYGWLQQHAADYGFIQRYHAGFEVITGYKAEEWHYRYVGVKVAKDMQARGVKTLEEYWRLSGGDY